MNSRKHWTERIKNIPTALKGAVTLVILVISVAVYFRNDLYLSVTVSVSLVLLAILCLSVYVRFSTTESELKKGMRLHRFESHWRKLALAAIILIPLFIITLVAIKPSRSFVIIAFRGTPTPTSTNTPTPINTPTLTDTPIPTNTPTSTHTPTPTYTPTPEKFTYPVQVSSEVTGNGIPLAEVSLQIGLAPPFPTVTDSDGFARFSLDSSDLGKSALLIVRVTNFEIYKKNVDLEELYSPYQVQVSGFLYPVEVRSNAGGTIQGATVTVEVGNSAPKTGITDSNGYVRIFVEADYLNRPAFLIVKADGYQENRQEIDLRESIGPNVVQLKLRITPTPTPTHTPTSTPIPTPTPNIVLNCDLDGGKLKPGESVLIELEVEGEVYFVWREYDIEWTADKGTVDPPDGRYTYYTAPDAPGPVEVRATVRIDDSVREFSCDFTIRRIMPYIVNFTAYTAPGRSAEVFWGVEGEFTSITLYCDGPSYCPDDGGVFSTEDAYGSVKVPKETATFELEVCNRDIDYCTTARTELIVH